MWPFPHLKGAPGSERPITIPRKNMNLPAQVSPETWPGCHCHILTAITIEIRYRHGTHDVEISFGDWQGVERAIPMTQEH
jgi:hypothetical protein